MTSSSRVLLIVCATLLLAGCTTAAPDISAPAPTPSADSTLAAPDWTPDLTIEREFTDGEGSKVCTILTHVPVAPSSASAELTRDTPCASTAMHNCVWPRWPCR